MRHHRSPRQLCGAALVVLLMLLGAVQAAAQDIPEKRRSGRRDRLDFPDPVQEEQGGAAEAGEAVEAVAETGEPTSSWWDGQEVQADARVIELLRSFEALEAPNAGARRELLDQLRSFGLRTRPVALRALDSPHRPTVLIAAQLLESVGEPDDATTLVDIASGVGFVEGAAACLETAFRLNGGWMPARAVRLLEHPQRKIRTSAEARLHKRGHEEHLKPLLQTMRFGRDDDARLRAARLLAKALDEGHAGNEVRLSLREMIDQASTTVCFVAAEALAGRAMPEQVEWLRREVLETPPGPRYAYLLFALLLQQETAGRLLVDEELASRLLELLDERDPFLSGAAAALLAEYQFRSEEELGLVVFEKEVLHKLVRAVAGTEFYAQYARFSPLAEQSLRRFTGEDFGEDDRSAWRSWMVDNLDEFRAVRGSLSVGPEESDQLSVLWTDAEGRRYGLAGRNASRVEDRTRWVGQRALEELLQTLEESRLLDVRVLPGAYGPSNEPLAGRIEIEVGSRRKRMSFRGDAGRSWLPDLLERLASLHAETSWQTLVEQEDRKPFVLEHLDEWDRADEAERLGLRVQLTRGHVVELKDSVLRAWCEELTADPGIAEHWEDALGRELLEHLPFRAHVPATAMAMLEAALVVPEESLVPTFLEVSQAVDEPLRTDLLVRGFSVFDASVAAVALADDRLSVRVAAARALGGRGTDAVPHLLAALGDDNPLVVRMALRSLGDIGDDVALDPIVAAAQPGHPREVRKEALWALGQLGVVSEEVLLAIREAAGDVDAGVRLAAVDGLGNLPGEAPLELFGDLFPQFAATPLEVSFLRVLERRGAGATRRVLARHLESLDAAVARRAALQAGRLADPDSAPYLIGLLPAMPRDEELLDALCYTLCVDFRTTPDPAGVYELWWKDNQRNEAALWLANAAAERGLVLPEKFQDVRGAHAALVVPKLLDLLENGPSFLRPATAYWLEQLTGVDAPALTGSSPRPLVQEVAQAWHAWLAERTGG